MSVINYLKNDGGMNCLARVSFDLVPERPVDTWHKCSGTVSRLLHLSMQGSIQ